MENNKIKKNDPKWPKIVLKIKYARYNFEIGVFIV